MATKQSTQLCYQVNGGTCQNKVSASNYYVCAAGHSKKKKSPSLKATLDPNSIASMSKNAKLQIARDPISDPSISQALLDSGDVGIQRDLAWNPSIDVDTQEALFRIGDSSIANNLARNPSIDHGIAYKLLEMREGNVRATLALNPALKIDMLRSLYNLGELAILRNLATNPSIDRDMAMSLFDIGDQVSSLKYNLSLNPSIDRDIAIKLAQEEHAPVGYFRNKPIEELLKAENLSLINQFPNIFSKMYLDRILEIVKTDGAGGDPLDVLKATLLHSYFVFTEAGATNYQINLYKEKILNCYENDEEVKYLLLSSG